MTRGTTPINRFRCVGVDLTDVEVLYITYKQEDFVVLEKEKEDCEIEWEYASVMLSQEETLAFSPNVPVDIQIRGRFQNGNAFATDVVTVNVNDVQKDGVI